MGFWAAAPARYIYILEAGSANPTVPPNLDLPKGTLWRLDVPHWGEPIPTGSIRYGEVPQDLVQRFPNEGPPANLTSGKLYYLYVNRDVFQPMTRCLFIAP